MGAACHKPITDEPREAALLKHVEEKAQAARRSMSTSRGSSFAIRLMPARTCRTRCLPTGALSSALEGTPPDLANDTRPKLGRLTQQLISALARVEPIRHGDDCPLRLADSVARWKHLTRYNSSMNVPLTRALSHVCAAVGVGAVG